MNPLRTNPLNAPLADGVRKVGFRKWYERELLSSHAHMALAVLAAVAMLGSLENMRGLPLAEQVGSVLSMLVSAGICYWAIRRYLFLLMRAEDVANQASCGDCGEYGRFTIVDSRPPDTHVCCRKCAHQWTISSET